MHLRFRNVKPRSLRALYFARLSIHTDITFPQPHSSELSPLLNNCPLRLWGLWTWKLAEGQRSPSGPTLYQAVFTCPCVAPSLRGKTFLVPSIKDDVNLLWSKFQVQFLCFKFLCSDTSPSVHFIDLTHSENSEKCLIYWLDPFLLPRFL